MFNLLSSIFIIEFSLFIIEYFYINKMLSDFNLGITSMNFDIQLFRFNFFHVQNLIIVSFKNEIRICRNLFGLLYSILSKREIHFTSFETEIGRFLIARNF